MISKRFVILTLLFLFGLFFTGCQEEKPNPKAEAPPPIKVERLDDRFLFRVSRPQRFQLFTVQEHIAMPELKVTGTVSPDVSRSVPVISLATGRVIDIRA